MTNNKPGNELISLQMAPVNHYHHHSRESKVPSPVTINNLGARLILEGRHDDALRYLSISMKHARALLARDHRHHHRRGSNGDLSCQPVNHPSSVVEGQEDPTTNTVSMDQQRRPSSHSRRQHSRPHRGAAVTMDSSSTGQQEAGGSNALETLGRLSREVCSTTSKEQVEDQPTDFANNVPMTTTPDVVACSQKRTTPIMIMSLVSSDTFVYADPIVLDDEPFVCHRHRQCLMKITVTILFNMALAHHLMARSKLTAIMNEESSWDNDEERCHELQRICRSDLKRAVSLYTLSCRIHVVERLSMNEMIAMAHLNNLGQIHAILGNGTLSKAFFEKLLSNLALYTESYRDGKHPATRRGRRRLAGFYRNAAQIILRGPELAPAA